MVMDIASFCYMEVVSGVEARTVRKHTHTLRTTLSKTEFPSKHFQITVEAAIRVKDDFANAFSVDLEIIPESTEANKQTISIPLTVRRNRKLEPYTTIRSP